MVPKKLEEDQAFSEITPQGGTGAAKYLVRGKTKLMSLECSNSNNPPQTSLSKERAKQ